MDIVTYVLLIGIATFIGLATAFGVVKILAWRRRSRGRQTSPAGKINLVIGDTFPPGALVFKSNGAIERTADFPEARYKWLVQAMSLKIEREPEDGDGYFERGKALMALGQHSEAAADFGKLIVLYPGWAEYYHLRGSCNFHAGDKGRALADLRRYKELERSDRLEQDAMMLLSESDINGIVDFGLSSNKIFRKFSCLRQPLDGWVSNWS